MIRKVSQVLLPSCGLWLTASLATPVVAQAQGRPEKIKLKKGESRIIERGEKIMVDQGSEIEEGAEIVVTNGELHIDRGLAKTGTGKHGTIKLRGNKAQMVVEGGSVVDTHVELSLGATARLMGAQATIIGGKLTNGRGSKIYLEDGNALAVGDSLLNEGEIYVDNHHNRPTNATNAAQEKQFTNRGHIKVGTRGNGVETVDGVRLGTIYGSLINEAGGHIEIRLPDSAKVEKLPTAPLPPRTALQPPPSGSPAYVQVSGSLGSSSGSLSITIDSSYYGQFNCTYSLVVSGATLNVTTNGTPPVAGTQFNIIKAGSSLTGTGFGRSNYTPSTVTYSHSMGGVYTCATSPSTRKCYPITK
jgi:hypothetical protein